MMEARRCLPTLVLLLLFGVKARSGSLNNLVVNEIMVGNVDCFVDPSWNFGSWVEVYNTGVVPAQLRGCWLSDDAENLEKCRIAQSTLIYGHSFATLWFGHHDKYCPSQIDMKLKAEGGMLYLSSPDGELLLRQDYPSAVARASWARISDGADEWCFTNHATPGSSNGHLQPPSHRLPVPELSCPDSLFEGKVSFRVGIPEGTTLRYTTDGSTPTLEHGETSADGFFETQHDAVYRFALFGNKCLSSPVVTRTFIKHDKDNNLPILSIATNPANLYSDEMGIFVKGTNGRAGLGVNTPCNWNMEWDRPVNFELLDSSGRPLINQEAEIRRCGGWSRGNTPFSFKIHAAMVFKGQNYFPCQCFGDKPYYKYRTLQIRNGGNETFGRVIDAFLQKLVLTSGMDVDAQAYEPVVHYINGVYHGVINMREPNNKQFVYANYGLDDDEIDFFEMDCDSGYVQKCGTREAFERLYALSGDAANEASYAEIEKMLDIDEFCNYMAVEMFLGNGDWPQANCKAWRPRTGEGRFRYILFDIDRSFESDSPFTKFENTRIYTFNTLYGEAVSNWTKEVESVTVFLNLLRNARFRRHFIDAFCLIAGSVFEPTRAERLIDGWTKRIEAMQVLPDNGYWKNVSPRSYADKVVRRLNVRSEKMYTALATYPPMQLSSGQALKVKLSANLQGARLLINGQTIPTDRFDGKLYPPVTLRAEAPDGYVFEGWEEKSKEFENADAVLIEKGGKWTYYDQGSLDAAVPFWRTLGFGTSIWQSGNAPFGYGYAGSGYGTQLDYGDDASEKRITSYFRKIVSMPNAPSEGDVLELTYYVDDGFVLYVNGTEAARVNMPEGDITFATTSTTNAGTEPQYGTLHLDAACFKEGVNVVAVEVHNSSAASGDLYWDASLVHHKTANEGRHYYSREAECLLPSRDAELAACFRQDESAAQTGRQPYVVINEVSASDGAHVNEYFKRADWVEIYNNTSSDVDLAGMYLSDNLSNVHKYAISAEGSEASTRIPAHGYGIIWCDKCKPLAQLHAPFKLANADSAVVVLTAHDGSWADTLTYCLPERGTSVGRFPDASRNVYLMSRPSIAAANHMNSYTKPVEESFGKATGTMAARPDMAHMSYAKGCLRIEGMKGRIALSIYTMKGEKVMSSMLDAGTGRTSIPIGALRSGIYIAHLTDKTGQRLCTVKFQR